MITNLIFRLIKLTKLQTDTGIQRFQLVILKNNSRLKSLIIDFLPEFFLGKEGRKLKRV